MLILMFILVACGTEQKINKSDIEAQNLNGKVKSIKNSSYEAKFKFGEIKKGAKNSYKWNNRYYYFNENGFKTETGFLDVYGRYTGTKNIYKYNENDILIESIEMSKNNKIYEKSLYKYKEGKLLSRLTYNSNDAISEKVSYKYDQKGKNIETNYFDKIDDLKSKEKSEYDKKGRILKMVCYNANGDKSFEQTKEYDKKGEKAHTISYYSNGDLMYDVVYEYNKKGKLIERKDNKNLTIEKFTYDKNGVGLSNIEYNFNSKEIISSYTFKYEYDNNNNWIKKITFKNEIPETIEEREILYY